jgi:hypothetical protein
MGTLPGRLAGMPSFTEVLGPYGDIVVYPAARTYLSWYPALMRGWSAELTTPPAWENACNGQVEGPQAAELAQAALAGLEHVVPGIRDCRIDLVDAGIIFSWGTSDIDDPDSELHRRHDVGVQSHDGYFSIDTGKFTCAPLFAQQLLERIS